MRAARIPIALIFLAACASPPTAPEAPLVDIQDAQTIRITPVPPMGGQAGIDVTYVLRRGAGAGAPKEFLADVQMGSPYFDRSFGGGEIAYVVVAVNAAGETSSPEVVVHTTPKKPTGLRALSLSENMLKLGWDAAPGVASWVVYSAPSPGQIAAGQRVWWSEAAGRTWTEGPLPSAVVYFAITAANPMGTSEISDEYRFDPSQPIEPPEPSDGGSPDGGSPDGGSPDGGVPPPALAEPGVGCRDRVCGESACCTDGTNAECEAPGQGCGGGKTRFTCDGPEDCGGGQCCLMMDSDAGTASRVECVAPGVACSSTAPFAAICTSNADCPSSQRLCCPIAFPDSPYPIHACMPDCR